jgi:ADP-heptose:LPS heptosyltransferase
VTTQVLILNLNRIGDLIQSVPLLDRLREECGYVAIDLVVNRPCAPMAALLPGVRHVFSDDVHTQLGHISEGVDHRALPQELAGWAEPWKAAGYDRVINLTFTRRSGWLAAALGVVDTRGVVMTPAGTSVVRNPWFTYCADMLQYRRFNRFNLVDLFALGGSGHGTHTPIHVSILSSAESWARAEFSNNESGRLRIAVQVGASKSGKVWRPDLFGRTMAAMSRRMAVDFVLTGLASETNLAQHSMAAYRAAGGTRPICDATGRTDVAQLAGLLKRCALVLSNDTSTMHLAVGVGVPVINISLGSVSFWETGPYGPGHWVIQPDSPHEQEQIIPDQVAELAVHVLGHAPFPSAWTGVRLYESGLDADGLNDYRQRAGRYDATSDWYGTFWRKFWYEALGRRRTCVGLTEPCPDLHEQANCFRALSPIADQLVEQATRLVHMTQQQVPLPALQPATAALAESHRRLVSVTTQSPAFEPLTVALNRDLQNGHPKTATELARQHLSAYQTFRTRAHALIELFITGRDVSNEKSEESERRTRGGCDVQGHEPMRLQKEQAVLLRA